MFEWRVPDRVFITKSFTLFSTSKATYCIVLIHFITGFSNSKCGFSYSKCGFSNSKCGSPCFSIYVFSLFVASLNVLAKPVLQNVDDLSIETPILDSNVDMINSYDTQIADCSSQILDGSFDDDQEASVFQKRSGWCRNNEGGYSPYSSQQTQQEPDLTPPTNHHDPSDICPHEPYIRLVSCSIDAHHGSDYNSVPRNIANDVLWVFREVKQCRAGTSLLSDHSPIRGLNEHQDGLTDLRHELKMVGRNL